MSAATVKLFADQKITVRVPKLDAKTRQPLREKVDGKETGRFVTEDQGLAPEHIIGARDEGDQVFITVADGNKYSATKPAK